MLEDYYIGVDMRNRRLLKENIDERFLEKETRIRNAFARAKIFTYEDIMKRAKSKYNLYYVTYLGKKSIKKINDHLIEKGFNGLPNYEKNLREINLEEIRKRMK